MVVEGSEEEKFADAQGSPEAGGKSDELFSVAVVVGITIDPSKAPISSVLSGRRVLLSCI